VDGGIGTLLDKRRKSLPHLRRERALVVVCPAFPQACHTFGIVAVHPIPERLTLHAASLRRTLAVFAIKNQRDRQHPPHDQRVLLLLGLLAKLHGRHIKPRNLDCSGHHRPPLEKKASESQSG
jgi:hypothetical protein